MMLPVVVGCDNSLGGKRPDGWFLVAEGKLIRTNTLKVKLRLVNSPVYLGNAQNS